MIVPPTLRFINYYPLDPANPQAQFENPADLEESNLLKDFDEEELTDIFVESLFAHLKRYPLRVFRPEQFDKFLSAPGERFIFTIAQTEIIEYDEVMTDRALIDTTLYRQDFLLRNIARNTWFEFVKVDDQTEENGMQVLYSNFFTGDFVDGRFRYRGLSGEVTYHYSSILVGPNDIIELNRFAGQRNARYIFEHLLNRYVQKNASTVFASPAYFRYNVNTNSLSRGDTQSRFIILEP